jgi:hypothetical protein
MFRTLDFGSDIVLDDVVRFIDSGRSVFVALNNSASEALREIANECGLDFEESYTHVVDHVAGRGVDHYGKHNTISTTSWTNLGVFTGALSAPVLYAGIAHVPSKETHRTLTTVLAGGASVFSARQVPRIEERPLSDVALVG